MNKYRNVIAALMISAVLFTFTGCTNDNTNTQTESATQPQEETAQVTAPQEETASPVQTVETVTDEKDVGYKTVEDLMDYFTEQVAEGDFVGASKAFAINLMAENYSLEKMMDSTRLWSYTYKMPYPSEDESYVQANKASLRGDAMEQISNMCFSLYADAAYLKQGTVKIEEGKSADVATSFMKQDLSSFKVDNMEYAIPEVQDSEENQEHVMTKNGIYGSDDFAEYVVNYEYNGNTYSGSVTFIQYEKLWYIFSLQSNLAGDSSACYLEIVK